MMAHIPYKAKITLSLKAHKTSFFFLPFFLLMAAFCLLVFTEANAVSPDFGHVGAFGNILAPDTVYVASNDKKTPFRDGKSRFEKPPMLSMVAEDIPTVLSENDAKLYKEMFRLQRALKRDAVVKRIGALDDKKILMGYLVAERLLHPSTKSSYADLKNWLATYHDEAWAPAIYKLANKRKPRRESHKAPSFQKQSLARYSNPDTLSVSNESKPKGSYKTRKNLLTKLRRYRIRKQYDTALELLNKSSTQTTLGDAVWHQVGMTLSRHMMQNGAFQKASELSRKLAVESERYRHEALWVAGFSTYMNKDKQGALRLFRRLAYLVPLESRYYARAAWWSARLYEELGESDTAQVFLNMAAQDELSFYGQMALERLQRAPSSSGWEEPAIHPAHRDTLFEDEGIQRVIALVQIGEHGLAQRELRTVYERIPYDWDESLLALSLRLDLPNTSLTLAYNLKERNKLYLPGMYPISSSWQPRGGLQVDRALLYAIIRQESAFKPGVISRAGARGLMQVMPATARFIRHKQRRPAYSRQALLKPDISMMLGQDYLLHLFEEFSGNIVQMIAAYNGGPGNVRKWHAKGTSVTKDPVLFIESIPFEETKKYVKRVLSNLWMYRKRFQEDAPTLQVMASDGWPTLNVQSEATRVAEREK